MEKLVSAYDTLNDKEIYENLVSSLFSILDSEDKWSTKAQVSKLDEKFEKEKQEILEQSNYFKLLTRVSLSSV